MGVNRNADETFCMAAFGTQIQTVTNATNIFDLYVGIHQSTMNLFSTGGVGSSFQFTGRVPLWQKRVNIQTRITQDLHSLPAPERFSFSERVLSHLHLIALRWSWSPNFALFEQKALFEEAHLAPRRDLNFQLRTPDEPRGASYWLLCAGLRWSVSISRINELEWWKTSTVFIWCFPREVRAELGSTAHCTQLLPLDYSSTPPKDVKDTWSVWNWSCLSLGPQSAPKNHSDLLLRFWDRSELAERVQEVWLKTSLFLHHTHKRRIFWPSYFTKPHGSPQRPRQIFGAGSVTDYLSNVHIKHDEKVVNNEYCQH